jgi:eukaryotic-like serine/threonine-protein kinase
MQCRHCAVSWQAAYEDYNASTILWTMMSDGAAQAFEFGGGATVEPAAEASNLVGSTLEGAYRITRLIAEGGMSAVYEAVQLRLNQRLAVKVMARELSSNREALARFHREAEITSRLRHPHLVTVVDFGTAPGGQPYMVMEYLEGTDLDHRIRQQGKLPLPPVVRITKQVASALGAAHDQGVVHRDLKPANVFLVELPGEPDFVKVLDFGISKVRAANTQLTKASSIIGTPNYMSPEQATGMLDEIDQRTDQWSLACIVWEMLAGRPPFASDDMSAVFYQVIHLEPPPLRKRAPDLPVAVEAVLHRALSKNMADRFPSIRDFASALASAATEQPFDAERATATGGARMERRRTRVERRSSKGSPAMAAHGTGGETQVAATASFWTKARRRYVVAALMATIVVAGLLSWHRTALPKASAPAVALAMAATAPMVAPPSVAVPATPPAIAPIAAAPLTATPTAVPVAPMGAIHEDAAAKAAARSGKTRLAKREALARTADPFEAPRRTGKHRPVQTGRVGGYSVGPFASPQSARSDYDPFGP